MDINNVFEHQMGKYGFVTVMNMVFKDIETKEPVLKLDSLSMSNINVEGSEKEIRGGLGNGLLLTYGYGRTATVEMEDVMASMSSLEFLFGAQQDETITRSVNEKRYLNSTSGGTVVVNFSETNRVVPVPGYTFDEIPTATHLVGEVVTPIAISWEAEGGELIMEEAVADTFPSGVDVTVTYNSGAGNFELSAIAVPGTIYGHGTDGTNTYTAKSEKNGDTYEVNIYKNGSLDTSNPSIEFDLYYETLVAVDDSHKSISLGSADFPKAYQATGQTFIIDSETGDKVLMEIEFPKFKLGPSFALSLQGDGDASTFKFDGNALEGSDGKFYRLKFLGSYNSDNTL